MTSRALLASLVAAASVALGVTPTAAQNDESILAGAEIDVSGYPAAELVVSLPAGFGSDDDGPAFLVTENGQTIEPEVSALSTTELDVVLAIDTSGSMSGGALDAARTAALAFATELPDQARIGLVGFGPEPVVALPLTDDREAFAVALIGLAAGGETALYDAVSTAAAQVDIGRDARTALVILSDGGDTVSELGLGDAAIAAAESFDVVHAVALQSSEQDTSALAAMVSGGGGVAEGVDTVALASVYTDLAGRITNQYRLSWETTVEADTPVEIAFATPIGPTSIERVIDVDEALIAELRAAAEAAAAAAAATTTTLAPVTTTTIAIRTELVAVNPASTVSSLVLYGGVALVALALLLAGVVATIPVEKRRDLAGEFRNRMPRGRELSGVGRRLVYAVEEFLRRDPDRQVGLALRIERAGLDIAPAEFLAAVVSGCAILALLGFGFFGLLGLVILPLLGFAGAFAWLDRKGRKRSELFTSQLDGTLQLMSGSLRSGFGIMQALGTVAEEADSPTSDEFSRILGEVRLGRDLGDAMKASSKRIDTPDYDWAIQAIDISREVGGNLAEVLDNVSQTIRQRNTLRRQVTSLSAEGRVSGVILFLLPIVMTLWMSVTNPDYIGLLFDRRSGQIALIVGVGLLITAGGWMRKIVRIPF